MSKKLNCSCVSKGTTNTVYNTNNPRMATLIFLFLLIKLSYDCVIFFELFTKSDIYKLYLDNNFDLKKLKN